MSASTENISFGGLSLVSPTAAKPGHHGEIRILGGSEPICADATVMSCTAGAAGYRIGVQFGSLALDDEKLLLMSMLDAAIGAGGTRAQQRLAATPARQLLPAGG